MKKYLILICFLFVTIVSAQKWEHKIEDAMALAKKSNQNILLVFSGSDWCAPCIKLDKSIWQSEDFKSYAKTHWVLLKADFPRKKANQLPEEQAKENGLLAEKYNKKGYFPLVLLVNSEGKVLGETGYKNITPKQYIDLLKAFEN